MKEYGALDFRRKVEDAQKVGEPGNKKKRKI